MSRLNPNSNIYMPRPPYYNLPQIIGNPNMMSMNHPHAFTNIYGQHFQTIPQQQQHIAPPVPPPPKDISTSSSSSSSTSSSSSSSNKQDSSSNKDTHSKDSSTIKEKEAKEANIPKTNTPYSNNFKNNEIATRYFTECTTKEYSGHKKKVNSISWSCDGKKFASGAADSLIRVVFLDNRKDLELKGHSDSIEQLKWSPINSEILASASIDKNIKIWDCKSGKCIDTINVNGEIINMTWHHDGNFIAVGTKEDSVHIVDLKKSKIIKTVAYEEEINEIGWTRDDLFILTSGTGALLISKWIPQTSELKPLKSILAHPSNLFTIDYDQTRGYLAVGGADANVSIWDTKEMICLKTFSKLSTQIRTTGFSRDGQFIAYASDEFLIEIGHVESGQSIYQIPTDSSVGTLSWHPTLPMIAYSAESSSSKEIGVVKIFGFHN